LVSNPTLFNFNCPLCCGHDDKPAELFVEFVTPVCLHSAGTSAADRADVVLHSLAQGPPNHTRPHTSEACSGYTSCPWLQRRLGAGWEGLTPPPRWLGCLRSTTGPSLRSLGDQEGYAAGLVVIDSRTMGQPHFPSPKVLCTGASPSHSGLVHACRATPKPALLPTCDPPPRTWKIVSDNNSNSRDHLPSVSIVFHTYAQPCIIILQGI
jgi:hypothetical protein